MRMLSHHFSPKDLLSMVMCSSTWLSNAEPLSAWYSFKCHYHTQRPEQDRKQRLADEEQQNRKQGSSIALLCHFPHPHPQAWPFPPVLPHAVHPLFPQVAALFRLPISFSHIIQIYGDAGLPDKAIKTFYTILEFNMKPLPKHLNLILEILVTRRNFLRPAFDLFRSAHKYGVLVNTESYNILMRAFCLNDDLSIAYTLFNQMFKRDISPNVESYRILMQGLCRKSQVNTAVDLLEDMLNKGFVPDALSYSTLLNSLCRKKKFKEAYKLLSRMKVKGRNPDIVHYNTVILGFCREGRAADACKILEDMPSNGCLPNLVSYRTLVGGLSDQGMYDEAKNFMVEMMSKGFSPHFSVVHAVVKGFCNLGKIEEACGVAGSILRHGEPLHADTWEEIVSRVLEWDNAEKIGNILEEVLRAELKPETRVVEVGARLGDYLMNRIKSKSRKG
ncbi:unnamed protein product [Withania somnifera]